MSEISETWLDEFYAQLGRVDMAISNTINKRDPAVKELVAASMNLLNALRVKANCEKYGLGYAPRN